jgi:DNA-binding beta-propeller fold protein YncE
MCCLIIKFKTQNNWYVGCIGTGKLEGSYVENVIHMNMMQKMIRNIMIILMAVATLSGGLLFAGAASVTEEGKVSASYLYTLSNFTGTYPISWAKIGIDQARNEVYVVSLTKIKIFNDTGMEIYTFNETGELGWVNDVAVHSSGDIIVLAYRPQVGHNELIRCDFRGEPISTIELKELPAEYAGFNPNRVVAQGDSLYLANTNEMKVIVTDDAGVFRKVYDIAPIIQKDIETEFAGDEKQIDRELIKEKQDAGMTGFSVDSEGNILFTNSALARVYRLSMEGTLRSFGHRGSSPGKFGVPADVATDATGKYLLVADTLRCAVLVFDKDFRFVTEFGMRGFKPNNLVGPMYIAVDNKNRVYVSQLRNRGVNVYQISESAS